MQTRLGPGGRGLAAVLTIVWIAAGAVAITFGFLRGVWIAPVLGLFAVAYGALWAQVARTGRRLEQPRLRRERSARS
jgi:hypothetical protein